MPGHHTTKQKRQAKHIVAGYKKRGVPMKKAKSIAWATVAKQQNESWMFNGAGQPVFIGNQGNVSQFDPSGSVSPGASYIPDEVAKMLVKESGLRKMDTVSKKVIEGYLESMRLSKGLAVDVAKVLRDVYGITPTFDESTLYARSGSLIEELTAVVENFPMPFAVDDEPKELTEADVFALAIQNEFVESTDENYDLALGHLATMSPKGLRDVLDFYEWVGPEVFDYIESVALNGPDGAAERIVEGLCWPHRVQFMPEHIQALFDEGAAEDVIKNFHAKRAAAVKIPPVGSSKGQAAAKPVSRSGMKIPAIKKQSTVPSAKIQMRRHGQDLAGDKLAAKKPGAALAAHREKQDAEWGSKLAAAKARHADEPTQSVPQPSKSRMKSAGTAAIGLMKKVGGGIKSAVSTAASGAAGVAAHVAHHAGDVAGAAVGGFKKGYNRFNKDVDAKVANIHAHGSTKDPEPGSEGHAEKVRQAQAKAASSHERKPGLISRALGHIGRFISNSYKKSQQRLKDATPGHQASKDSSGEPEASPAKQRVAKSGVPSSESVLRSGSLLSEVEAAFSGIQPDEDPEDPELTPADVVGELDATAIVDMAVLEAIGEMDWNGVAGIAGFMLLDPERFLGLIQSFKEGTSAFRAEWSGLVESGDKPSWMSVGSFVTLANLSVDEGVIPRLVYWAAKTLQGADERVSSYVAEAYPELGKTVYGPAGDPKEGPMLAKSFMTPHPAGAMKPTDGDCTTRMFSDPDDREKERKSKLADVMAALDGMRSQAAAAGVPPEGMFLNLYRDMHREKVRYS